MRHIAFEEGKRRSATVLVALLGWSFAFQASANDVLQVLQTKLDRPTIHTLGLQVLIAGDDNRNARIAVRYRSPGGTWRSAMDLFRAQPLGAWPFQLPPQFSGSLFDLLPGSTYELELHATDPDGNINLTWNVTGRTRGLPRREPASPRVVPVTNGSTFSSALANAQPGDVILLAPGTYDGPFTMTASGTAENPIVIRGEAAGQVIIDGGGCHETCQALLPDGSNSPDCCNGLELTGDHIHVESVTIRNVERALAFEGSGLTDIVARRIVARDVDHGIASGPGDDGYFCDNDLEGHLVWPWVFGDNPNQYWDRRGIDVAGDGHVICHNRLKGFGDPVVNKKSRSRGWDAYGNDIFDSWDGAELDEAEANARLYLNRFTNVMAAISMQPAYGGPLYAIRNVALNTGSEQIKLKSLFGTYEPSGALILHNTFVSPIRALTIAASITQYNFAIENNLFVGPSPLNVSRTVSWDAGIDAGRFDYNGYFPDGQFFFKRVNGVVPPLFQNFFSLQASGLFEQHGVLLTTPVFAQGFVGPAAKQQPASPADFTLAPSSNAIDLGKALPGINSNFTGTRPDLGAIELGCPPPLYGPRPPDQEQYVAAIDCRAALSVAVVRPNGGEKLFARNSFRIDWTAAGGSPSSFDVKFSSNGGTSFANVPGCVGLAGTARSCTWASPGPVTTAGRIQVIGRASGGTSVSDTSNANYSIVSGTGSITVTSPNTAVNWGIGSTQQVKWNSNLGPAAMVTIDVSRNGGTSWAQISGPIPNTGTFDWVVSGPATLTARIRVNWANGPTKDASNVNFKIAAPFVTVTAPNTALKWGIGTQQAVTWSTNLGAADTVRVLLSTNGGAAFPITLLASTANDKSEVVTVPNNPTAQARVRVDWIANPAIGDMSNVNFVIAAPFVTVTKPNGGEVWVRGTNQTFTWTSNLGAKEFVKIELSADGGAAWTSVLIASTPSDGSQAIRLPMVTSTRCRARITWLDNTAINDISNANFTIKAP